MAIPHQKDYFYVEMLGGPTDAGIWVTKVRPPHGMMIHWKHETRIELTHCEEGYYLLFATKSGMKTKLFRENGYLFKEKGLTHIYVYSEELNVFAYGGLFPIQNPLGLDVA